MEPNNLPTDPAQGQNQALPQLAFGSNFFTSVFFLLLDWPFGKVYSRPLRLLFFLVLFGYGVRENGWLLSLLQYLQQQDIEPRDVLLVLVSAPFAGLVWYWRNQDRIRELETKEREVKVKETELESTKLHRKIEQRKLHREELTNLAEELESNKRQKMLSAYNDITDLSLDPGDNRLAKKSRTVLWDAYKHWSDAKASEFREAIKRSGSPFFKLDKKFARIKTDPLGALARAHELVDQFDSLIFIPITACKYPLWVINFMQTDLSLNSPRNIYQTVNLFKSSGPLLSKFGSTLEQDSTRTFRFSYFSDLPIEGDLLSNTIFRYCVFEGCTFDPSLNAKVEYSVFRDCKFNSSNSETPIHLSVKSSALENCISTAGNLGYVDIAAGCPAYS